MGSACMMDREIDTPSHPSEGQWQELDLEAQVEATAPDTSDQESASANEEEDWEPPSPADWEAGINSEGAYGAKLEGELGPVTFDTDVVTEAFYSEPGYSEFAAVTIDAEGGAAMAILFFNADLSHPALQPGAALQQSAALAAAAVAPREAPSSRRSSAPTSRSSAGA